MLVERGRFLAEALQADGAALRIVDHNRESIGALDESESLCRGERQLAFNDRLGRSG